MKQMNCSFPESWINHLPCSVIWILISLSLISISTMKKSSIFLLGIAEIDMPQFEIALVANESFCVCMILSQSESCLPFPIPLSVKQTCLLILDTNHRLHSLLNSRIWPMGGIQCISGVKLSSGDSGSCVDPVGYASSRMQWEGGLKVKRWVVTQNFWLPSASCWEKGRNK